MVFDEGEKVPSARGRGRPAVRHVRPPDHPEGAQVHPHHLLQQLPGLQGDYMLLVFYFDLPPLFQLRFILIYFTFFNLLTFFFV